MPGEGGIFKVENEETRRRSMMPSGGRNPRLGRRMPGAGGVCWVEMEIARWRRKLPGEGGRSQAEEKEDRWRRKMPGGGGRCQVKEENAR